MLGLFSYNEEAGRLDPVRDAYTTPGTFSPQCGLTGTVVLKGGDCLNALGWYNAVENPTTAPTRAQIYEFVPGDLTLPPMMCEQGGFCPLATRMHNQAPNQHRWADPLPEFAGNIRNHPMYAGGLIGFALLPPLDQQGRPMGLCQQIKFSQAELNQKSPSGAPWVTTLIYQSAADPGAYYIAFEDQPMCPTAWQGGNCGMGSNTNDGDFNDFVFRIKGLSCKLGGEACEVADPNIKGICKGGITECTAGGMDTRCRQAVEPTTEKCDALDNDCDGEVDEGDLCPVPGICDKGVCVNRCSATEFPCDPGYQCDEGLCKDPRCIGRVCGAEQICLAGTCIGGCGPDPVVVCPHGQRCQLGNCVEPCAGVTCGAGEVCEDGACQPPCNGKCRACKPGRECDMTTGMPNSGKCMETGCQNRTCPAGQVCKAGSCQDGCLGVTCPGGQECRMGRCTPLDIPDGGVIIPPVPDGGIVGSAGTSGSGSGGRGGSGASGNAGRGGSSADGAAGGASGGKVGGVTSCKCDTAQAPGTAGVTLLLLALLVAVRRRRA